MQPAPDLPTTARATDLGPAARRPAPGRHVLDDQIERALRARHPLLYLHTSEEARAEQALRRVATSAGVPITVWSCSGGLDGDDSRDDTRDAAVALDRILTQAKPGLYVFKDLAAFMGAPPVTRLLRDAYYRLRDVRHAHLVVLAADLDVPSTLRHNVFLIDAGPPDVEELAELVGQTVRQYTERQIPPALLREAALALRGVTLDEARHVMHSVLADGKLSLESLLDAIREAKKTLSVGTGFLEYVPHERGIEEVGGLARFKAWIDDRATVFNQRAVDAGVPVPRGILIMGVSGCGKSLCAKVIAKIWNVPLFRLDMNLVFAEIFGNAEASFHRALKTIEALAPAVLWIDEIENGLGFSENANPTQQHIFSAFLTWMQEKPPLVFVAATANRIESLPAELIRKGRFDQVFFVDLPSEQERAELLRISLRRNGAAPDDFDIRAMLRETRGWNAAEIEQVIDAGRIRGIRHKRAFTTQDVLDQTRNVVPLSRTMSEQIQALRDWAWDRATPASGDDVDSLDG